MSFCYLWQNTNLADPGQIGVCLQHKYLAWLVVIKVSLAFEFVLSRDRINNKICLLSWKLYMGSQGTLDVTFGTRHYCTWMITRSNWETMLSYLAMLSRGGSLLEDIYRTLSSIVTTFINQLAPESPVINSFYLT